MKLARILAGAAVLVLVAIFATRYHFGEDAVPPAPASATPVHVDRASAAPLASPVGVALDGAGNLYVADSQANVILKINPSGVLKKLAGGANKGYADGSGTSARFSAPEGIAADAAGNVYVADRENNAIRKITPEGVVSTQWGANRGSSLNQPAGVALDGAGDLYVADTGSHSLRKMTAAAMIKTVAGSPRPGHEDGHDGAGFNSPAGVAVDAEGSLYVADSENHTIRRITRGGWVTTLAGAPGQPGRDDGMRGEARFFRPAGVAVDGAGNVYVADTGNHAIRRIAPDGKVSTLAGGTGMPGHADGAALAAEFNGPRGIALDAAGNLYVADTGNRLIRRIAKDGTVTTIAGVAASAAPLPFHDPSEAAVDAEGNLYVAERGEGDGSALITRITPAGARTALVRGLPCVGGLALDQAGTLYATDCASKVYRIPLANPAQMKSLPHRFSEPLAIARDSAGNLYVAEDKNSRIRRIAADGADAPFAGPPPPDPGAATQPARLFDNAVALAADRAGNLYVADQRNNTIVKFAPDGAMSPFAGNAALAGHADGAGRTAIFNGIAGIAADGADNLYVTERDSGVVRKITPAGVVTTLAGAAGITGRADGAGKAARFNGLAGLAVDRAGNLYVADRGNNLVRRITPQGVVATLHQ